MSEKKRRIKKKSRGSYVLIAMLTLAICLAVYPGFADSLSDCRQTIVIGGYLGSLEDMTEEERFSLRQEAEHYNELLRIRRQTEPFRYQGEDYDDPLYDAQLTSDPFSNVMAYVEIPKTGAYIPIVHGTSGEDLTYQAGHLYGTSLPVGGSGTHAVIAAHTGLEGAQLFDGLDRVECGDRILLHVLGEGHVYTVAETNVVLPNEADYFLQIEEGEDLLTLYTCTPYGINSHRLLVRCRRTGDLAETAGPGGTTRTESRNLRAIIKTILWGLLPFSAAAAGVVIIKKKEKRQTV